jgi:hypothetical protein
VEKLRDNMLQQMAIEIRRFSMVHAVKSSFQMNFDEGEVASEDIDGR